MEDRRRLSSWDNDRSNRFTLSSYNVEDDATGTTIRGEYLRMKVLFSSSGFDLEMKRFNLGGKKLDSKLALWTGVHCYVCRAAYSCRGRRVFTRPTAPQSHVRMLDVTVEDFCGGADGPDLLRLSG